MFLKDIYKHSIYIIMSKENEQVPEQLASALDENTFITALEKEASKATEDALKTILPNFPSWKAYIFGRPDRNLDFNYLNSFESHRQIKLMGEKPNSIVKSYLEKAEISCVPSKWNEPLSLSVLESLESHLNI